MINHPSSSEGKPEVVDLARGARYVEAHSLDGPIAVIRARLASLPMDSSRGRGFSRSK